MLETNEALAILPEKTIVLNDRLKAIANPDNNEVMIHVYTHINNTVQFEVELS